MYCPYCRHHDSRVIDSRTGDDGAAIRRRRACPACGRRFTTQETVILTVAVDDRWNYYLVDYFRKRCTKLEGVSEMFRQYNTHKVTTIGLERRDKLMIDDVIEQYAFQAKTYIPRIEPIVYPPRMSKEDRIETVLQPLFESHKVYLIQNATWLTQELLDFPRGAHDDGLDALVNLVHVSRPALSLKKKKKAISDIQKRIMFLKKGIVYTNEGEATSWKNLS